MSADEKHLSADEKSPVESRNGEDFEQESSNKADSALEAAPVADFEKTALAQDISIEAPEIPDEENASLKKLDSKVVDVKDNDPFGHLPEHERVILKRQVDVPEVKVGYFTLYRYATKMDVLILIIAGICAIGGGAAMPLMTVSSRILKLWTIRLTGHSRSFSGT
jgi:ATP-binding cassette, subfamily B (MDR/TAP), member 1